MKRIFVHILFFFIAVFVLAQQNTLDLSGEWRFQMDPQGTLTASSELNDKIVLPGSMPQRDKGLRPSVNTVWTGSLYDSSYFYNPHMEKYRRPDNFKLPFFLTPDRHYVGDAWYSKSVVVPASFQGKRIMLHLERPHITTTLFIDGKQVGTQNSLSVAHEYDVTPYVTPGKNADICLKINNDADKVGVGQDSHSVTDQTQGNWNGVAGCMELRAYPVVRIAHMDVFTEAETKQVRVNLTLVKDVPQTMICHVNLGYANGPLRTEQGVEQGARYQIYDGAQVQLLRDTTVVVMPAVNFPQLQLWDEFNPKLYTLKAFLFDVNNDEQDVSNPIHTCATTFGIRTITTRGKDILVNGRPTLMRGTVENCCFPLTGYAPTDKESWMNVFRQCKAYGLNHMRFHSYCPPEAAFDAADELGFYLQPEGPSWPNHGIKLGNGMMIDDYLMKETQRMVEKYGNHPSFAMLSCGNEPAGNWVKWVSRFVDYWKAKDSRRIYTGASVGGGWAWQPKNQYHVKAGARGLDDWSKKEPGSMTDFRAKIDTVSQPFISHETGQWCAFPDLDETSQYTGVYKAKNFDIFRDILAENGMADKAKKFLQSSGKLQVLCYKYEMEKTLRTPHYAGFQLLGLNDYSGQGTALVGPLNVFWKEKGYVDSTQWRSFSSPVTILSRLPRFTYFSGDTIPYSIEVSNYGMGNITATKARVQFLDRDSNVVAQNLFGGDDIPMGACNELGTYSQCFNVNEPTQFILRAELFGEVDETDVYAVNHWNVWVYPRHSQEQLDSLVRQSRRPFYVCNSSLDKKALDVLNRGGNVLVLAGEKLTYGSDIIQNFTPVFWNTSWFKMRPPHTTGMYVDNQHPLFRDFPTDDFNDLQWWALMNRQKPILMDKLPSALQPIVQPIDTWFLSRKLGMLFEAKVGKGNVLFTTLPLSADSPYPAVEQMTYAIYKYMNSSSFRPSVKVKPSALNALFTEPTPKVNMFTKDSPDELKKGVK